MKLTTDNITQDQLDFLVSNQKPTPEKFEHPGGGYIVNHWGAVVEASSEKSCREFGLERSTEDRAKVLQKKLKMFLLFEGYRDAHGSADGGAYVVYAQNPSDPECHSWMVKIDSDQRNPTTVYFSHDVAGQLVNAIYNGSIFDDIHWLRDYC